MLTIRLQRVGRVHQPDYRIVLAEKHRAATKQAVEILGSYNPQSKDFKIKDEARLKHWLSQHVEVSPTVWNLFVKNSLVEGKKLKAWRPKVKEQAEAEQAKEEKPAPAAEQPKTEVENKTPSAEEVKKAETKE
jgi:small subunit ribosomal protein S16